MEPTEYDISMTLDELEELIILAENGAVYTGQTAPWPQIFLDLCEIHEGLTADGV